MREERLDWPSHHMLIALVTAQRSADTNTQVGCCIVSKNNRVLGVGYNGPPKGICPSQIPWAREHEDPAQTKYPWIVHAEKNAIYNAYERVNGATLFVTMHPCHNCAKDIISADIKEVIYLTNPYEDEWSTQVASEMLQIVDITCRQHEWDENKVWSCFQDIILSIAGPQGVKKDDSNATVHGSARDSGKSGSDQPDLRREVSENINRRTGIRQKTKVSTPE